MINSTAQVKSDDLDPIQGVTVPSLRPELTPTEQSNVEYLTEKFSLTENDAIDLVKNDEQWSQFMKDLKKKTDLKDLALIDKVREKVVEKTDAGFLEAASKGAVVIAILRDKIFGQPSSQGGPTFNVAGKSVTIKTGFNFKPYKK